MNRNWLWRVMWREQKLPAILAPILGPMGLGLSNNFAQKAVRPWQADPYALMVNVPVIKNI